MGITLPIHQGLSDFTKSFSSHHVSLHLTKDSLRSSRGPADTLCARGACPLGALLIGHAVTAYMGEALPAEGRAEQGQDAGSRDQFQAATLLANRTAVGEQQETMLGGGWRGEEGPTGAAKAWIPAALSREGPAQPGTFQTKAQSRSQSKWVGERKEEQA